ncbi:unnamed protein product, partial [Symbiodinium pilosum]
TYQLWSLPHLAQGVRKVLQSDVADDGDAPVPRIQDADPARQQLDDDLAILGRGSHAEARVDDDDDVGSDELVRELEALFQVDDEQSQAEPDGVQADPVPPEQMEDVQMQDPPLEEPPVVAPPGEDDGADSDATKPRAPFTGAMRQRLHLNHYVSIDAAPTDEVLNAMIITE